MLKSDWCDYSDGCIAVKGDNALIKAANENFIDARNRTSAFKKMHHLLTAFQR